MNCPTVGLNSGPLKNFDEKQTLLLLASQPRHFFFLSYYTLIITPQGGLTVSQFHVILAYIQSSLVTPL